MVSMLFVATIPMILLGIVMMGGESSSIIANIGLTPSIFIITLITLSVVVMWSFFLANSITNPIVRLSKIATSMSTGELKNPEIELLSNDEIGERPRSTAWSTHIKSSIPSQRKITSDYLQDMGLSRDGHQNRK